MKGLILITILRMKKEKILVNSNLVLLLAVGELLNFDACKLQLKLILRVTTCYVNYIMFLSRFLFCFLFVLTFFISIKKTQRFRMLPCKLFFFTNGEHKMHT